jgi:hypothetical protein
MADISLSDQLVCARHELRRRTKTYPLFVAHEEMTERTAQREIAAMTAIVRTLQRLVLAEQRGRQPALWAGD